MATAEELMAVHEHSVTDTDTHFIINPDTRKITNDSHYENILMQYDHNSEVYTFELPRYIEGHDMLLCNRVYVHFNNIDGTTGEEIADLAEMTDLALKPDSEDTLISSWQITRHATQLVGVLSFLIEYMCVTDDGVVTYEWHTDIYSDVQVKSGRNNGDAIIVNYSNILEEWYRKLFGDAAAKETPAYVRTAAEVVAEKIIGITGEAVSVEYTNQLPISIDSNGSVYNGVGYLNDKRLGSSGAVADLYNASAGWGVSGFIHATNTSRIRVRNVTINPSSSNAGSLRWCAYDSSFNFLGTQSYNNLKAGAGFGNCEFDENGYVTAFSLANQSHDFSNTSYIRLTSETHFTADSIITVDEEISEGQTVKTRVPFNLAFLTDLHWDDDYKSRLKSAAQALSVINETATIDAVVFGGDYISNWSSISAADAKEDIANCRKTFADAVNVPALWLRGNHENNPYPGNRLTRAEIFNRVSRAQNTLPGFISNLQDPYGCYGYMDFDNAKIRLVAVNTSDNDTFGMATLSDAGYSALIDAYNISAVQLQWIADNALDFSGKTDPSEWGIIFLSHVPIYNTDTWSNSHSYTDSDETTWSCNIVNLADLVKAYADKSSFTASLNGKSASKDFSGLTATAKVLCFVHGHKHAMITTTYNGFKFIACPNMCDGALVSDDDATYNKSATGTVGETAFSVLTVDPANEKVYAWVYGAGHDREIDV